MTARPRQLRLAAAVALSSAVLAAMAAVLDGAVRWLLVVTAVGLLAAALVVFRRGSRR